MAWWSNWVSNDGEMLLERVAFGRSARDARSAVGMADPWSLMTEPSQCVM
jgi:hypothetical protein